MTMNGYIGRWICLCVSVCMYVWPIEQYGKHTEVGWWMYCGNWSKSRYLRRCGRGRLTGLLVRCCLHLGAAAAAETGPHNQQLSNGTNSKLWHSLYFFLSFAFCVQSLRFCVRTLSCSFESPNCCSYRSWSGMETVCGVHSCAWLLYREGAPRCPPYRNSYVVRYLYRYFSFPNENSWSLASIYSLIVRSCLKMGK